MIEHANGQRYFVASSLTPALEEYIEHFLLTVSIRIVVDEVDPKLLLQRFHQLPRIRAVTAQVKVDRGGETESFAFGQAELFVQQLHEQVHGVVIGEVGCEVHGASSVRGMPMSRLGPDFAASFEWNHPQ